MSHPIFRHGLFRDMDASGLTKISAPRQSFQGFERQTQKVRIADAVWPLDRAVKDEKL